MIKKDELEKEIKQIDIEEKSCNKIITKLSLLRLLTFLATSILGITCIVEFSILLLMSTILSLGLFISLIIIHNKKFIKLTFLQNKKRVLNEYLDRHNSNWRSFKEKGENIDIEVPFFTLDIDVIGDNSLFQFINVCKTSTGKKELLNLLINGNKDLNTIKETRDGVKDYTSFWNENIAFQAYLKEFDKNVYKIKENAVEFPKISSRSKKRLFIGLILTVGIIVGAILAILKIISPSLMFGLMMLQFILNLLNTDKGLLNSMDKVFLYYHSLKNSFVFLSQINFNSAINKEKKEGLLNALNSIKKMDRVNNLSSIYHNALSNLIFNLILPFNEILILKYLKFSKENSYILEKSFNSLVHFEVIASLATINFVFDNICEPNILQENNLIFTNLKHPLLNEETCVSNSFNKEENINIITGSNMSGKTSFLRTIAINIVLMKAGSFALASSFSSALYNIFTSMRVKDDLAKGISSFYAELLRIKDAIEYSNKEQPTLVLIDEIFKGTNMNDRLIGAKSIMKKMDLPFVLLFISTHDFELCDYSEVKLANYHFSEYYENDKIKFDYLLKRGKCQTSNAIYLMKNTGVMD